MPGVAHQVFNRMFVPVVIAGIWGYAHFESIRPQKLTSFWHEGNVVRIGNPYTAPVPPRPTGAIDAAADDVEDVDASEAWTASAGG